MISNEELEKILLDTGKVLEVKAKGDGYHYNLLIVSDEFKDMNILKRQKWVYSLLGDYIKDGRLHALNMKTYTKEEWGLANG